jgi:hypothetical protein
MHPLVPVLLAALVPGSGHVVLGKPARGLIFIFWIVFFGALTNKLAGPEASFVGRYAGGIAIWTLSVVDVWRMAQQRKR